VSDGVTIGVTGSSFNYSLCGGAGYCWDSEISNSTHTIVDTEGNPGSGNTVSSVTTSKEYISLNNNQGGVLQYDNEHNVATAIDIVGSNGFGWCFSTSCQTNNAGSVGTMPMSITFLSIVKDYSIKQYGNGFELPNGDELNLMKTKWTDYISNPLDDYTKILNLHYKILDPTLTSPLPFALYYDGSNYKIIQIGSTVKYSDLPSLTNYTIDYLILDLWSGGVYPNLVPTSALTSYTPTLKSTIATYNTVSTTGAFTLPSGYSISPDSGTTNRKIISTYTNTNELSPSFVGLTTGLTSLSILVKNSPSDYALIFKDTQSLLGDNYIWSIMPLTADNTVTVDLPTGLCVYVIGVTIDTIIPDYNEFGTLCASGTMPKTIIYSSNLSFTFWSLPYGVSHTFAQQTETLQTKVRHDTTPYNYTIRIFDANNVLQYEQEFLSTNSTIQTETHNATGITFPALLRVYDNDGNQIYYSTIGIPGYLSASVAWFSQWLTISGFNLLFMLPLVFGAMFTRNTVGIGTMISVVFIATLTWLGVLPIPDVAIWFMFIIAAIGIVAYKKLYD
jgi:hypothetical protein